MISRIWHGWTRHEDADKYEALLRADILPGINRVESAQASGSTVNVKVEGHQFYWNFIYPNGVVQVQTLHLPANQTFIANTAGGATGNYVGATAKDLITAKPVLQALGDRIFYVGKKPGQGAMAKTVNQLLCGVHLAVAAEALHHPVGRAVLADCVLSGDDGQRAGDDAGVGRGGGAGAALAARAMAVAGLRRRFAELEADRPAEAAARDRGHGAAVFLMAHL